MSSTTNVSGVILLPFMLCYECGNFGNMNIRDILI